MRGDKTPIDIVRQKGDILDADSRFRRRFGTRALTLTQILSTPSAIAGGWSASRLPSPYELQDLGVHMAVSNQAFLLSSVALSSGSYLVSKQGNSRRVSKRVEALAQPLGETSEPIDIFRAKDKDRPIEARWYGIDENWSPDNQERSPHPLSKRMHHIADLAEEHDIHRVSIGTWQLDNLGVNYEEAGAVHAGPSYITDQKKTRIKLADNLVDAQVLTTTPEQLHQLAEQVAELEAGAEKSTVLDDLVAQLRDVELGRRYAKFKKTKTEQSLVGLRNYARSLLEQSIGDESYQTSRKDQFGIPQPVKAAGYNRVSGQKIVSNSVWRDSGNNEGHEFGGNQDILRYFNSPSIEKLVESLAGKKLVNSSMKDRAAAAIYLLSYDISSDKQLDQTGDSLGNQLGLDFDYPTTTLQLHGQAKLRTRRLALKGSNEAKDRLAYSYRRNFLARKAGAAAMISAGTLASVIAGTQIGGFDMRITNEATVAAQETIRNGPILNETTYQKRFQDEYEKNLGSNRDFTHSMERVRGFEKNIAVAIASTWSSVFGNEIANLATFDTLNRNWDLNLKNLPDGAEAFGRTSGSNGLIGDVPGDNERNKVIFSVTSPKGLSTEGYWYDFIYNGAKVTYAGQPPLKATVNYMSSYLANEPRIEILHLPYSEADIAKTDYDYVVSTPFVGNPNTTTLWVPVIQGGEVVAAVYTEQDDPSKRVPLEIYHDPASGSYATDSANHLRKEMIRADINHPQLLYYIKKSSDRTFHNTGKFFVNYTEQDAQTIASQLKTELGLAPNATNQDVYNQIKKRNYSYTPIEDQHFPSGVTTYGDKDSEQTSMLKIGKLLAHLESLNCNLASTLQMLATADGGEDLYQQARGYHDNGDGKLVQGEAHAWLINKDSDIVDPTPSNSAPRVGNPDDSSLEISGITRDDLEKWGGVLVEAATLILAYQRRQKIAELAAHSRANYLMNHATTPVGITEINAALYGSPNGAVTLNTMPDDVVRNSIAQLPDNLSAKQVIQNRKAQGEQLTAKNRRAIRRILRHRKTVR